MQSKVQIFGIGAKEVKVLPVVAFHIQTLEIKATRNHNVALHFVDRHVNHRIQRFHFVPQIFILFPNQCSRYHRDIVGDQRNELVLNQPDLARAGCDVEAESRGEVVLQLSKVRILVLLSPWRGLLLGSHGVIGGTAIFRIGTIVFIAHTSLTLNSTFVIVLLAAAITALVAIAAVAAVILNGLATVAAGVALATLGERGKSRRLELRA